MASDKQKVVIITGANSGIGLETAKTLCELGHDVIISVRDDIKGRTTTDLIKSQVKDAKICYITMEMSDPNSIREFVEKFRATGKKLNILINNAGLFMRFQGTDRTPARGDPSLEISMIVNCMGPFLLTNLLIDDLKATATKDEPSRIVNVSSNLTNQGKSFGAGDFLIEDLMLAKKGAYINGLHSYRNSKIALNMWSIELAEKLKSSNVTVNTVCPGFIPSTGLKRDNPVSWKSSVMLYIMDSFLGRWMMQTKPVSSGRDSQLKLALDPQLNNKTGLFFVNDEPTKETPEVEDEKNKVMIWQLCDKYSGLA